MAKDPFSAEAQQLKPSGSRRFTPARVTAGVLGIGLATMLVGFYMPLSTAQGKLKGEYEGVVTTQNNTAEQLKKTTEQLVETQQERDELAKKMGEVEKQRSSAAEAALDLNSQVKEKLSSLSKKNKLSVSRNENKTEITIDNAQLFRGHEVSVHRPGKNVLCAVAKALKGAGDKTTIQVEGHTRSGKIKNPLLRRNYPTAWEASAARAAHVVLMLRRCGFKSDKISAAGFAEHQPNPKYPKRSSGEIRLVLSNAD